tara:strand:+ start:4505 stop:4789 length:285 start_codon:yes stop_codon:yes gene_type:complete
MALTKSIEVDKLEIVSEFKHIQIRTATIIKEDGVELSRSFNRRSIPCGSLNGQQNWEETDVSNESADVKVIAAQVWTQSVKDAYKLYCENNNPV